MKKIIFKGAGVAIVTPMNADSSINYDVLGDMIEFQIANKTDAVIICGTTGESSTLSDEEHLAAIGYAVKKVAGRVPVIAGAGSNDTSYAIWLSKKSAELGADALLHVTPYYNKTSQLGLIRHFSAIADATALPVILYNVPSRTGVNIQPDTYFELSKHPNIAAAKEANGNLAAIARTIDLCGNELGIYSGNDDSIVPTLSLGGLGVISVLSNVAPRQTHDMCELYFKGEVGKSAKLQLDFMKLIDALFCDVNPIPVKAAMNMLGYAAGECRLPLAELSDKNKEKLKAELVRHGLIK